MRLPDFRSHSKSAPFTNQPLFNHSKSVCVWISDPHYIPALTWKLDKSIFQTALVTYFLFSKFLSRFIGGLVHFSDRLCNLLFIFQVLITFTWWSTFFWENQDSLSTIFHNSKINFKFPDFLQLEKFNFGVFNSKDLNNGPHKLQNNLNVRTISMTYFN